MPINYGAVFLATVAQFVVGAVWYTPVFGNLWGKIHGFDRKSKAAQDEMKSKMGPLLLGQFLGTLVTSAVFALLLAGMPSSWNVYGLAGFFWIGFVVPTQISAVLFGGTDPKWILTKIAVMAGGSLACLEVAAFVFQIMK